MSKVRFELNLKGLNELMKSNEMQKVLDMAGEQCANNAGDDYDYRTHVANYVAITNVYPTTKEAASEVYKNNSLVKALFSTGLKSTKR